MTAEIEKRLDGWAGSFDWREALAAGEITENELLAQLADLEQREGREQEEMKMYRVFFNGYGDGYEDFEAFEEALRAKAEWEAEYGEGEARILLVARRQDVPPPLMKNLR